MPFTFTFAHPAAVLPLFRGRLVAGALVAGSMAPDVAYFVPMPSWAGEGMSTLTHSVAGIATVDLVIGLVLYGLWRWAVRCPTLALLPEPWRGAATRETDAAPDPRHAAAWSYLGISVVIGVTTHLLLDLVTHESGPDQLVGPVVGGGGYRWGWLQVLLSIVGLAVLAWWCCRWLDAVAPARQPRPAPGASWALGALAAGALAGGAWRLLHHDPVPDALGWLSTALVGAVVGAEVVGSSSSVSGRVRTAVERRSGPGGPDSRPHPCVAP